jgi:hypothetical protein
MKTENSGRRAVLFGLGATIVYLVMVLGTLRYLTDLAGVLPFDLRPTGFSQADAAMLLEALGETGRQYYLMRQLPLDTVYPALLALTLISTLRWRSARFGPTLTTRIGVPLAILAATFDYLENLGIGVMLRVGKDPALVQATSTATMLKSALTSDGILAAVFSVAAVLPGRMSRKRA